MAEDYAGDYWEDNDCCLCCGCPEDEHVKGCAVACDCDTCDLGVECECPCHDDCSDDGAEGGA